MIDLTKVSNFVSKSRSPTNSPGGGSHCHGSRNHCQRPSGFYGVGIVTPGRKVPNRGFHSLLIAVEAKTKDYLAPPQPFLVAYISLFSSCGSNKG